MMNTTVFANATNTTKFTPPTAMEEEMVMPWSNIAFTSLGTFGVLTNLICFIVFMSPMLKDQTYTCMMVNCLVDLIFLLLQSLMILFNCGPLCAERENTVIGRAYNLYLIFFFSSSLSGYSIFIVVYVSILRCMLILNKKFLSRIPCKYILAGLLALAIVLNCSPAFSLQIVKRTLPGGAQLIIYGLTDYGRSKAYSIIAKASLIFRLALVSVVLPAINIYSAICFKMHLEKKKKIENNYDKT